MNLMEMLSIELFQFLLSFFIQKRSIIEKSDPFKKYELNAILIFQVPFKSLLYHPKRHHHIHTHPGEQ